MANWKMSETMSFAIAMLILLKIIQYEILQEFHLVKLTHSLFSSGMGCQLTRISGFQWTAEIKYGLQDNKDKVRDDMLQAPGLVCVLWR